MKDTINYDLHNFRFKKTRHIFFCLCLTGFLLAMISTSRIHIGENYTEMPLHEYYLEEIMPWSYWLGLVLMIISSFLLILHLTDKITRLYFILSSILIMVTMRAILPLTMSRPYSADGYFYVYWLKIWLTEGIQLVPGPSIATPLLWYYPHTHPIAFLVAYLFT